MQQRTEPGSVALEITFTISPKNRVEFLQTVESLLSSSASEGARVTTCYEQIAEENRFLWRECWTSQEEVEVRLRTGALKTLLGAIGVLGEFEQMEILGVRGRTKRRLIWA